jgi:hypothetical protein
MSLAQQNIRDVTSSRCTLRENGSEKVKSPNLPHLAELKIKPELELKFPKLDLPVFLQHTREGRKIQNSIK